MPFLAIFFLLVAAFLMAMSGLEMWKDALCPGDKMSAVVVWAFSAWCLMMSIVFILR